MAKGSFSLNALISGLEELGWDVLLVCTGGVHHVREGIVFPPKLSKCDVFFYAKSPL